MNNIQKQLVGVQRVRVAAFCPSGHFVQTHPITVTELLYAWYMCIKSDSTIDFKELLIKKMTKNKLIKWKPKFGRLSPELH